MAKEPITRSSIEAFIGFIFALLIIVYPMTFYLKLVSFIILGIIIIHLIWNSPWTIKLRWFIKVVLSLVVILLLVYTVWNPLKEQWLNDHPVKKPEVKQPLVPKIESEQPKKNNIGRDKSLNKKQPTEQPKLSELIKSDFPDLTKISREHTLGIKNGTTIKIFEQEYFDGDSRSKFFGFYVPFSPYAYDVCKWYSEGYKTAMNQIESKTIIHLRHVGEVTETSSTELVFSGRIYIYYEDNFSLQQLAELERAYQSQGLAVAFRGKAYLLSVWDYLQDTKNTNRKPLNLNDN